LVLVYKANEIGDYWFLVSEILAPHLKMSLLSKFHLVGGKKQKNAPPNAFMMIRCTEEDSQASSKKLD
jgi:hypothetical protein